MFKFKRKNLVDGGTMIGFALILSGLTGEGVEKNYLFGLIPPKIMILGFAIGSIATLIYGIWIIFSE